MEIWERIGRLVSEEPEGPAIQYDGRWWTWGDLGATGESLRSILGDAGIGPGEGVGIVLRQRPDGFAAELAVWAGRQCAVLITPIQPDLAMCDDIAALRLRAIIAYGQDWRREGVRAAALAAGSLGIELTGDRDTPARLVEGLERQGPPPHYAATPGVAVTVLTSGTTGPPKRILLGFDQLAGAAPRKQRPPGERGVSIGAVPLVSIGGVLGVADSIWRGRPTALMDRFDIWSWAKLVQEHKPRQLGAPPAALRMLLDQKVPREYLASGEYFIAGSAPVDLETTREFEAAYGIPVLRSYGATEFLGNVMRFSPEDLPRLAEKYGSVGRPGPNARVRIVDPATRKEVARGETGILEVDPVRRPAGTPPGWMTTNDLARMDEDDFVWIVGRADGVLIRGGFKVSIEEVGDVLRTHPAVADAAVVGLPDPALNQVPVAVVSLRPGAAGTEAELLDWVKARKPPYCTPVRVLFVDEVPRNAMLKIMTGRVREIVDAALAAPR